MAVTQGHGNPRWTRDETLLALALYLECGDQVPGPRDARVVALSGLLRRIPYHAQDARKPTFRNPDGVAFKLQNIRQVATGAGLGNVSRMDRETWAEFSTRPDEVRTLANNIRQAVEAEQEQTPADVQQSEEREFAEGRMLTRVHLMRERNSSVREALLTERRKKTGLRCDMCDGEFLDIPASQREAVFEAHHTLPLSTGEMRRTKVTDLALLCACCHRLIHRFIQDRRRWVGVEEARQERARH